MAATITLLIVTLRIGFGCFIWYRITKIQASMKDRFTISPLFQYQEKLFIAGIMGIWLIVFICVDLIVLFNYR